MGTFFFIDYIVSYFVLLAIDAPSWAWFVYAGSALFWFVFWALSGSGTNQETTNDHENSNKTQQQTKVPCTED